MKKVTVSLNTIVKVVTEGFTQRELLATTHPSELWGHYGILLALSSICHCKQNLQVFE